MREYTNATPLPSHVTPSHKRANRAASEKETHLWRVGHSLEVANVSNLLRQARFRLDGEEYQGWGAALSLGEIGLGLGDGQQGIFHLN